MNYKMKFYATLSAWIFTMVVNMIIWAFDAIREYRSNDQEKD